MISIDLGTLPFDLGAWTVVVFPVGLLFWLSQLLDVPLHDSRLFESHTHKLIWFLVVLFGNLLGALWYFLWKQKALAKKRDAQRSQLIRAAIELWRAGHDKVPG